MRKSDVMAFFDRCAPTWDAELVRDQTVIDRILDNAGVGFGVDVLDVACGTGVLIPDYLQRGVGSVTAIDLSSEMVKIAGDKFHETNVEILRGDAEEMEFEKKFDCIVIYNAFPHFPDPERLIGHLAGQLKCGGRLTVAHGMSRAQINRHHSGSAQSVSVGLMHEDALAALMSQYLTVETVISDDRMYQVTGRKGNP